VVSYHSGQENRVTDGGWLEGLNGRLPNQDLLNSFRVISHHTGSVPVLLYDHYEPHEFPGRQDILSRLPNWIPKAITDRQEVIDYSYRARNIFTHLGYQARGMASGVHGLLHQYYYLFPLTFPSIYLIFT